MKTRTKEILSLVGFFALIAVMFFLMTCKAWSGPLQNEILRIAPEYVGFRESQGDNKGPEVNKVLASVGLAPGNPWCMALVYKINTDAARNLNLQTPILKTGLASGYWVYANKRKLTFKSVTAKQIMLGVPMEPACTGIFKRGDIRADGTFKGHADVVLHQIDKKTFYAIDGNTGSDDKGDQGEGDGSFFKTRRLGLPKFPFVGCISIR